MINRIKLAIKILLGYDIIIYEERTKIAIAMINGNFDVMNINYEYAIDKGNVYKDNNGEIRYFGLEKNDEKLKGSNNNE